MKSVETNQLGRNIGVSLLVVYQTMQVLASFADKQHAVVFTIGERLDINRG